jgi:hypothetical protein
MSITAAIRAATLWLTITAIVKGGVLRPELGAYLKDLGSFNPSTEEMYATIVIPIPRLPDEIYNITALSCNELIPAKNMEYTFRKPPWVHRARTTSENKQMEKYNIDLLLRRTAGLSICEDYNRSIKGLTRMFRIHHKQVDTQQDNLMKILQSGDAMRNYTNEGSRGKHALPIIMPILAAAKTIGSLIIKAIQYKRTSNLKKVIDKLGKDQSTMKWFMIDEANKATTFQRSINDTLGSMKADIKAGKLETDMMIKNLTTELMLLQERTNAAENSMVHITNALSKLNTHTTTLLRNNLFALSSYNLALSEWTSGAMGLTQGRLRESIISPLHLNEIIQTISGNINNLGGHLELLSTNQLDYYSHAHIMYTTVGENIVVQIPMPLRPKQSKLFTLYELQTVYMPLDTTWFGNRHNEYTKLLSDRKYIAMGEDSHIEMTTDQFRDCRVWSEGMTCEGKHVYVANSRSSCLKLLYSGYKIKELMKHCSLMYYRGYQAAPGLIETDNYLLITGFGDKWTHSCEGRKQNTILRAKNFMLIPKQKFGCSCTLQNEQLYIEGSGHHCITQIQQTDMLFPMNAMQHAIFETILPHNSTSRDTLYNSKAMPTTMIPRLHIKHSEREGVLMKDNKLSGIPIAKIQRLVASKQEIYLTRSDLIAAESLFHNWFRSLKPGKIATFILALTGTATGLLSIYLLLKFTNLSAMVASLALIPRATKAESTEGTYLIPVTLPTMILTSILQAVLVLTAMTILALIWKVVKQSQVHVRFLQRKNKPKIGASRSNIYIEISDGEVAHVQHLISVGVHGSLIHDIPQDVAEYPQIIAHERHWINDILTISWKHLETITLTDQDILHLPHKITIAFADKAKIRKMLMHSYTVRIIIESGGLLWQISHKLMESRIRRWSERIRGPHEAEPILKDNAEPSLLLHEDRVKREKLIEKWHAADYAAEGTARASTSKRKQTVYVAETP